MKKHLLLITILIFLFSNQVYSQCTDTIENGGNTANSTMSFGQSFQPSCSGKLNTIAVIGDANTSQHTVSIYNGLGTSGTLLGSLTNQNIVDEDDSLTDFTKSVFDFSALNIDLVQNSNYTFVINGVMRLFFHAADVYSDGEIFFDEAFVNTFDLNFQVDITNSTLSSNNNEIIQSKLTLYPNPSSDYIKISGLDNQAHYEIFNITGKKIINGTISQNEKIDISQLTKGFFLMKINDEVFKFIVE